MPRRLNLFFHLLALPAVLLIGAGTIRAQEKTQPAPSPAGTDEKKAESTPWPPPGTDKVPPIKRDEQQKKGLELYVPKTWEQTKPTSPLRLAQFTIPAEKGDQEPVELAIFSFKGGAGGGVQPNVLRWINQFQPKDRQVKITTGESKQGEGKEAPYVFVDIKGTYNMQVGPPIMGKTKPLPNARMLAVIIGIRWEEPAEGDAKEPEKKSAIYFLKMAGPEKTVTANEKAFRLAFGAADEENDLESREEPAGNEKPSPQ